MSFFSSWFLTFGYVCVVALNATAFSLLVKFLLPDVLNNGKLYTIAGWTFILRKSLLLTVLLLVFMLVTIRGASVSGSLQYYFCVAMVIVVLLMFFFGSFFGNNFALENLKPLAEPSKGWLVSIVVIVSVAPWAYVGFEHRQNSRKVQPHSNKTFKLIVYSLLAASLTNVVMILYTGWLSTSHQKFRQLWLAVLVTNSIWLYWIRCISNCNYDGIFTGLNGFLMSSSRCYFMGMFRYYANNV